jgi:hypothetical protein
MNSNSATPEQKLYFLSQHTVLVEAVAKQLSLEFGGKSRNPDKLEPGNLPYGHWPTQHDDDGEVIGECYEIEITDGELKGGLAFYYWRQFVPAAVHVLMMVYGRNDVLKSCFSADDSAPGQKYQPGLSRNLRQPDC